MIILGIDPGPEKSAYIVWDTEKEVIIEKFIIFNTSNLIFRQDICLLAIEIPLIFGKKVWQQVIDTAFEAGRIIGKSNLPYKRIAPFEWKLHIAGHRGANDQLVRQALMARFGPKGTKKNPGKLYGLKYDLWDALGIAVYAGDIIKNEQL